MRFGHLAFILFLVGTAIWYAVDVYSGARQVYDWMLIVPAAALCAALLLGIAVQEVRAGARMPVSAPKPESSAEEISSPPEKAVGPAIVFMGLLVCYVAAIPYVGIDVATFAFLVLALRLQGERSWPRLVAFSLILSVGLTYTFKHLLAVSIETLVL